MVHDKEERQALRNLAERQAVDGIYSRRLLARGLLSCLNRIDELESELDVANTHANAMDSMAGMLLDENRALQRVAEAALAIHLYDSATTTGFAPWESLEAALRASGHLKGEP